jgi:hypothetical protein
VLGDVRFGSKANMRLPLIDVRFVPIAEIALTYSITSSTREWRRQYVETEFFRRFKVGQARFGRRLQRQIGWLLAIF